MNSLLRGNKDGSVQFNCFSPPVMIATFVIELALACYTVWRYKLNSVGRLVVAMLLTLALFQLCEYNVCGHSGFAASVWSRIGYVAITALPALGLHLLHIIAKKPGRKLVGFAYATMVGFSVYFLLAPHAFNGYACTGNYVIFQIGSGPAMAYSLYYYGWLFTALLLGWRWARASFASGEKKRAQAVQWLMAAYLVFIVPTITVNMLNPETLRGVPSIMCGFAVLCALILVFFVLPRTGTLRQAGHHQTNHKG
ncbi:hypothetical protein EYC59_04250 [Candidatus Saccharibacteria bacterium]|nr:MAG: hypothetical protein EYC59_04250 [Candidatus Saccharibacteria bacterium]